MTNLKDYKEERLSGLRQRLSEINDIIGLDAIPEIRTRTDAFGERMKDKKIEEMKRYFDEMVSIKKEIAKLEGRKGIFDEED